MHAQQNSCLSLLRISNRQRAACALTHAQKDTGSFIFQDFEPPEATLRAHARSKTLGPVIVQDFEPSEASLRGHACSKTS